ncbi:hypothetical protein [Comamonas testosteroni]|uniref:hypothetical protein n=1 Tax=Comamonas testosteroni TaxID=285 RepID=UPI000ACEBEF0|nr:hypothetical protein [Comamonas testosteroni]
MSTTPSYISSMFAKVASTAQESPVSPLPGQEDQSVRLAASAEVGQVEGTIHQVYRDYMAHRATLEEMLLNGSYKNCREHGALFAGVAAITTLLRDRGVEA